MYAILVAVGLLFIGAGGVAWFYYAMVSKNKKHLAIPTGLLLAFFGALILNFNVAVHPGKVRTPEIIIHEIKVPEIHVRR